MGKWSTLPSDLLNAIEDHLVLYTDKIRICSVCVEWNSYLSKLPDHKAKQVPWLLYPLENNTEASHGLFNPVDEKVYYIYLPESHHKLFKGSSYGWMVTLEDFHSTSPTDVCLINPLTRAQIKLPPRTEFPDVIRYNPNEIGQEFVVRMYHDIPDGFPIEEGYVDESCFGWYSLNLDSTKVVMSSAPCNECLVVAIYGQPYHLAWCRINDRKWTHIYTGLFCFIDTLFCKGCLYALNDEGRVLMFENIGTSFDIKVTEIVETRIPIPRCKSSYLVECSDGSLIVVARQFYYDSILDKLLIRSTAGFKIYKIESNSNKSWVEVKNIGDDVLFIGNGSARSIPSSHFRKYKRNHIYFTDSDIVHPTFEENKNLVSDVGVFNLEDGTLESLPGLPQRIWPQPIWINVG